MTLLQSRKAAVLLWTLVSLRLPIALADGEFQYFSDPKVDFWKKSPKPEAIKSSDVISAQATRPLAEASSFPWKKYLDPKNEEFFKEGDYTPPPPFMEIARNPSDENIENWFKYLEAKNDLTKRLQSKLTEYSIKHHTTDSGDGVTTVASPPIKMPAIQPLASDTKRFRLRLYFDSKCPHCEHMMETLKDLSRQGYWIELKQIDQDVSARAHIPFPVTSASRAELTQYHIESVPLLLIGDLTQKTVTRIQGYQTPEAVLHALSTIQKPKGDKI